MRYSEDTSRLVGALKEIDAIDLDKLFASGIDITIHNYTDPERTHVDRVTVHAEDAGPILSALREAVVKAMKHRQVSLRSQLASIDSIIGRGSHEVRHTEEK